jgi:uncharacterized membrane protein YeaQ/YmgE (transglycosylase-associated protein family)
VELLGLLADIVVGVLAGWLAGRIRRGRGYGLLGNLLVGVVGAIVGDALFGLVGLHAGGFLGSVVMATAGAAALLYAVGWLRGRGGAD